jgi:hypothetical protein
MLRAGPAVFPFWSWVIVVLAVGAWSNIGYQVAADCAYPTGWKQANRDWLDAQLSCAASGEHDPHRRRECAGPDWSAVPASACGYYPHSTEEAASVEAFVRIATALAELALAATLVVGFRTRALGPDRRLSAVSVGRVLCLLSRPLLAWACVRLEMNMIRDGLQVLMLYCLPSVILLVADSLCRGRNWSPCRGDGRWTLSLVALHVWDGRPGSSLSVVARSRRQVVAGTEGRAAELEASVARVDSRPCVVCLSDERSVVLMPCRHLCCCADCASVLEACPLCRTRVGWRLDVFDSA